MGRRTSYPPGTFSWVDLATTDAAGALAFYTGLFGWETEDRDAGGGVTYTLCRLEGYTVCGLFAMTPDMRATGLPPAWTSYVSVADATGAAARARELGGGVVDEAFALGEVGRMAVLRDPGGAVFAVWQAGRRIGAERVNDVGCLCMNELITPDPDAARPFYEALFGWTSEAVDLGAGAPEGFFHNDGAINGSFFSAGGDPPHWRSCFTVAATDAAVDRVRELGGEVLREPVAIGDGSLAVVRDPQGAVFSVFAGETDP